MPKDPATMWTPQELRRLWWGVAAYIVLAVAFSFVIALTVVRVWPPGLLRC